MKDFDIYNEQLMNSALIGRLNPQENLSLLLRLLQERTVQFTCLLSLNLDQTTLLFEQCHWLILLSGSILCDSNHGETPLIPSTILQSSCKEDTSIQIPKMIFHLLDLSSNSSIPVFII